MLQAIRNRAQGIFAWVMLVMVGVPFALWGIQNYMDSAKEQPVAVVGDREIFERDVNRVYEQTLSSLAGVEFDEAQIKREALERLIREEVISQDAADKKLAVSDEDIRGFVQTLPYFQTEGKYDKEKYKLTLSSQGMSSLQFASQVRKSLSTEQYQKAITDTSFVTKQQIEAFYRLRNQERQVEYLTVVKKKWDGKISDEELDTYYQSHKAEFQNPEQVSVQYLTINLEDLANTIKPSEEELKNLYEEQRNQLTNSERRKVRHILVAADSESKDTVDKALDKATKISERITKGEDFAKVAKEVSDDKVSAEKGGDLGFLTKDSMDPNFAKAAFSQAQSEVSKPVKSAFGYHIIQVTEIEKPTTKTFAESRAELEKNLQRSAAENKFYELGQTLTEQAFEHPDSLEPAAKVLNLKIEETPMFTRDSGVGVAAEKAIRDAAFSEDVGNGKNSEAIEVGNDKVYVLRLKERRPASTKPLAEVKQELIARLQEEKAKAAAKTRADELVALASQGKPLAEIAKTQGFTLNKPPAFQRNNSPLSPKVTIAVFKTSLTKEQDKQPPELVELDNGDQLIFKLVSIKDGSAEKVEVKELEMAREFLQKNIGQSEFAAMVGQLRAQADVYLKPAQ